MVAGYYETLALEESRRSSDVSCSPALPALPPAKDGSKTFPYERSASRLQRTTPGNVITQLGLH